MLEKIEFGEGENPCGVKCAMAIDFVCGLLFGDRWMSDLSKNESV